MTYGVVTITLNSVETVRRTIASVLGQHCAPAEYIFVDGGSDDGTLAVLEETVAAAPRRWPETRCRLLHQVGGTGIAHAWNMGVRELRTDVVFILNSDDWYVADAAATVLDEFARTPAADLVIAPVRIWCPAVASDPVTQAPRPFWCFPFLMPVMHPACFVSRAVYERVGLYDEQYRISADYDFVYRCVRAGMKFRSCPTPLTNMQAGGRADSNRALARRETRLIGCRHARVPLLPWCAYLLRVLARR